MAEPISDLPDRGPTRRKFLGQATGAGAGAMVAPGLSSFGVEASAAQAPVINEASTTVPVSLKVNGRDHQLHIDPRTTLLDLLRENLGLTGSKKGCDHGQCGSCTILANGRRINSCLALAVAHDGADITTIEGLAHGDELHPMQEAFIKCDGFQCGYCTPGQIMSAVALMEEGCPKTDAGIREMMSGNICRCGAYNGILQAIRDAQNSRHPT
jgi:xanthine dehydrogenase YagT iron-sulfur-binding subunit